MQSGDLIEDMLKYTTKSKQLDDAETFLNKASEIIEGDKIMTMAKQFERKIKLEVAKNMLSKGLDPDLIKEVTKLSDRDLKSLIKEQK